MGWALYVLNLFSGPVVFSLTFSHVLTQKSHYNKLPATKIVRLMFAFPPGLLWSLSAQPASQLPYPSVLEARPDVNTVWLRVAKIKQSIKHSLFVRNRKVKEAVGIYLSFDKCMASEAHCVFILWTAPHTPSWKWSEGAQIGRKLPVSTNLKLAILKTEWIGFVVSAMVRSLCCGIWKRN